MNHRMATVNRKRRWPPPGLAALALLCAAGPLLAAITNPKEYQAGGRRSLVVRLEFRTERTLTDAEVTTAMARLGKALRSRGYEIRE